MGRSLQLRRNVSRNERRKVEQQRTNERTNVQKKSNYNEDESHNALQVTWKTHKQKLCKLFLIPAIALREGSSGAVVVAL